MRILWLTPYPPFPPESGGTLRMYRLLREAAARHTVELYTLSPTSRPPLGPLADSLAAVRAFPSAPPSFLYRKFRPVFFRPYYSPALWRAVRARLACGGVDLLHVEELCLVDAVPRTAVPTVLSRHKVDVFFYRALYMNDDRIRRFRWQADLAKILAQERRARRRFTGHVLCSQVDANRLQTVVGRLRYVIVPNGVDLEFFRPMPLPNESSPPQMVFLGSMDYPPNVDAVGYFAAEILPRIQAEMPQVRFTIVGRNPAPAVRALHDPPRITVTGRVPDVRPYLQAAGAVVVPLRVGEGTRLKILEALAAGRPVVSTKVGAEGLRVKPGEHLLLADEPESFAQAVLRVLRHPALATRLATEGRRAVEEHYGWGPAARLLLEYYELLRRRAEERT